MSQTRATATNRRFAIQALAILAMAGWLLANPRPAEAAMVSECTGVRCSFSCDETTTEMTCYPCEVVGCLDIGTIQCFGPLGEPEEGIFAVLCGGETR